MDTVEADLHEHEEAPLPGPHQVLYHLEVLLGHVVDVLDEAGLVVDPELDVDGVIPDEVFDLLPQLLGVGVVAVRVRGDEASDKAAINGEGGVAGGHPHEARPAPDIRDVVPDPLFLYPPGGRDPDVGIRVLPAVAEAVEAEDAGRLARRHHGPRGYRDGGITALQSTVDTPLHHPLEVGEFVDEPVEEEVGGGAVQPYEQCLSHSRQLTNGSGCLSMTSTTSGRIISLEGRSPFMRSPRILVPLKLM